LVTGGGGFLGGAIVGQLVARGCRVRSFSRRFYPELDALGVAQIQGDLRQGSAVAVACAGMATVFHVAAKAGVWGAAEAYHQINVTGTRHVLNACRESGVKRLIYTSSPSVVFDGRDMEGVDESVPYPAIYPCAYPQTKALAEQAVLAAADERLAVTALRPHLIWGPRDNHLVPRILARGKRLARVGSGRNRVDTIYIDNAAAAHLLAAETLARNPGFSGRVYFISQDDPVPLWWMVDQILAAGGQKPVTRSISHPAAYAIGGLLELVYRVLPLSGEPPMTRFVAQELSTSHWFDISAAKRDLGYQPQTRIPEGLAELGRWLKAQSAEKRG
jgi:nucleoside-diphosphate-sugar epimerase